MRQPKALGYVRVSTDEQDVQQQRDYVTAYYQRNLAATHSWGGMFEDDGVSAYSTNWLERPGGRAMWQAAGLGDAIVVLRLDRAVRGSKDAAECWKHLESKRIDLHFVDGGLQSGGASGRFAYQIHSAVAELSSGLTAARTKEMKVAASLRGECTDSSPRPGYRLEKTGERRASTRRWIKMQVPNLTERKIIEAAYKDFRNQRPLIDICDAIQSAGILRSNGQLYADKFMGWAMHCMLLQWPLTFSMREYYRYRREARQLGIVLDGKNRRDRLLGSLVNVERLVNEGHDFSRRIVGHPFVTTSSSLNIT